MAFQYASTVMKRQPLLRILANIIFTCSKMVLPISCPAAY